MTTKPVLVVEDDELIRENLRDILELEGFRVETAENGKKGLERIKALDGNCLVLLDLQMPVMTGEELLQVLRAETNAALRATPIIVITARGTPPPGLKVPFLHKPIDLDLLLTLVKKHV